jgi:hypothetical protein
MQRARQAALPLPSATSTAVRASAVAAMASLQNATSTTKSTSSEPKFPLEVFETLTNATGDSSLVFGGDGAGAHSSENVSSTAIAAQTY